MPMMEMNRNYTIHSTRGHSVRFAKDVPILVADDFKLIALCLQYGAKYVDPSAQPELPDEGLPASVIPKTPAERRARINSLLLEMKENQAEHRMNFTGQGRPSVKYVATRLDFDVSASEIETLWGAIMHPTQED